MRTKTQDPKYDIEDGRLINAATGEPIPEDEPIFILRAKDRKALDTLAHYFRQCRNANHILAVSKRILHFVGFSKQYPERMKEPDTK